MSSAECFLSPWSCCELFTKEWVRLQDTTVESSFQPPCSSRVLLEHIAQIASRQFWNIPSEGASTTSLGNLFPCSVTPAFKFFLIFRWHFLFISFYPLSLVLLLETTEKSLASSSWHPPSLLLCFLEWGRNSHSSLPLAGVPRELSCCRLRGNIFSGNCIYPPLELGSISGFLRLSLTLYKHCHDRRFLRGTSLVEVSLQ